MKTPSLPLVLTLWALSLVPFLGAAEPLVSNVKATQSGLSREVFINYDLSLSGAATTNVTLQVSSNGGGTWLVPASSLSGNGIGSGVTPGKGKLIVWNAMTDWPGQLSPQTRFKVTASDFAPVGNMVPIPGGTFQMGDNFNEGWSGEVPVHSVTVSAFYLQNTEVTKAQWDAVRDWGAAAGRGYTDLPVGGGKAANHPVHSISWHAMVKWCNARSQMENLAVCYTVDGAQIYKTGSRNDVVCNWNANGYRLPTEAEWERAARGGESDKRFPWGDIINHSHANYYNSNYSYESPQNQGYHPAYNDGVYPLTSPVGSFAPNAYGLHDMAGNLWEWCWDWFEYYPTTPQTNPRGPVSGSFRVLRGGSWFNVAYYCRTANRYYDFPIDDFIHVGFRPARSSVPQYQQSGAE